MSYSFEDIFGAQLLIIHLNRQSNKYLQERRGAIEILYTSDL